MHVVGPSLQAPRNPKRGQTNLGRPGIHGDGPACVITREYGLEQPHSCVCYSVLSPEVDQVFAYRGQSFPTSG
jgi:hypothetical protein